VSEDPDEDTGRVGRSRGAREQEILKKLSPADCGNFLNRVCFLAGPRDGQSRVEVSEGEANKVLV
jgi:hypothetical protein